MRRRWSPPATFASKCPAEGNNWPTIWFGTCRWPSCPMPAVGRRDSRRRWPPLDDPTVKVTTLGACWRCETRDVGIAVGLDDAISVQKNAGDASTHPSGGRGRRACEHEFSRCKRRSTRPPKHPPPRCAAESLWRRISTWTTRAASAARMARSTRSSARRGAERIGELQVIEVERSG